MGYKKKVRENASRLPPASQHNIHQLDVLDIDQIESSFLHRFPFDFY